MKGQGQVPGTRYGSLVVVGKTEKRQRGHVVYEWRCDCGNTVFAMCQNIKVAKRPSCGCKTHSLISAARTKHGHSLRSSPAYPTYVAWQAMLWRCTNPSRKDYPQYGGRGITVCERWTGSYENFLADMGERPSNRHSLDRINVNGNYEPGNCRWATTTQQANNKRTSRVLEFNGKALTVSQWATEAGLPWDTLKKRLENGWSAERALTTPVLRRGPVRRTPTR